MFGMIVVGVVLDISHDLLFVVGEHVVGLALSALGNVLCALDAQELYGQKVSEIVDEESAKTGEKLQARRAACSRRTTDLKKPFRRPSTIFGRAGCSV